MIEQDSWITVERPGYLGSRKDQQEKKWNRDYGEDGWRLRWVTAQGEELDFDSVFWRVYVAGYTQYFRYYPQDLEQIIKISSYTYDKDLISEEDAYNPHFLVGVPNKANQFHHVALNIAVRDFYGKEFQGSEPLQVRGGKPNTPKETWPRGWEFHPGLIPAVSPEMIPAMEDFPDQWWENGTIEDFYQKAKVLQVKID